jgi:hypothetical protein
MGSPAAQCKGKVGGSPTGNEAVRSNIIRHCTDSVLSSRQQATVPFLEQLRSSLRLRRRQAVRGSLPRACWCCVEFAGAC